MPEVSFHSMTQASQPAVEDAVSRALDLAGISAADLGQSCLVKINAMSQEVLPGRNSGPWVVEALLSQLRKRFPELRLTLADSDVAGYPQFGRACRHWGYDQLARRFDARVVNLAREPYREVSTNNPVCPTLAFPRAVFQSDSIINLPVMKTHVLSGISCCLKNHWGLLPRLRYQYHRQVHQVIAELNRQVEQTVFNLVDATVAMEGSGPKTGLPRPCGLLLAGRDRVACDAAALDYMGLPRDIAPHVRLSQEAGVGVMDYRAIGDAVEPAGFEPPSLGQDIVSLLERRLRAIPGLGRQLYRPQIAPLLGWVGTMYNEQVWFRRTGRAYLAQVLGGSPWGAQFASLPGCPDARA
ncbi:MAG: DUF362 domain-containing protein [Desulfarculaceae bacterium]|nr:DUF362 domain-containing protein [Desulfarculaceae bacterium]MCF8073353.1 DUF362 domain-containing protein [Desulfarculaceae bacterium]MCF8103211.1 DUF362 domain-containing protein [Desulfarculaceae bacterium]MCF8118218.1 DUF362 domain-containing protein [Desulfarculaceae bacterium]